MKLSIHKNGHSSTDQRKIPIDHLFVKVGREVASLCRYTLVCMVRNPGEREMRTALTIPAVGPGLGAQGAEGVVELLLSRQMPLSCIVSSESNLPACRGGNPRPWQWYTCSSRHSSASSAWSCQESQYDMAR